MPISLAYARDHQVSGSKSLAMRGRTLNYTGTHRSNRTIHQKI